MSRASVRYRLSLVAVLVQTILIRSEAAVVTNAADALRTGWYPDQQSLTPQLVSSGPFAQRFSTVVTGQVYAQPLVTKGSLIVATEANWVYRIDPENGNIFWSKNLGPAWNASDIGCGDLTPTIGVTGTPVIDESSGTVYLVSKTYASGTSGMARYYMHALDVISGAERTSFPVEIQGTAQNNSQENFTPLKELQRPGLLLLDGVVYASFGGHCDITPWHGWIIGVSTSGQIKTRWITRSGHFRSGAAIWHSGGGLVSDGPGRILFATGNGGSPSGMVPGNTPPADLGESVVRVNVQPDGSLQAMDFFTPTNGQTLDLFDQDLGSGGPAALPSQYFGTPSYPNLLVEVGKEGWVYLMNRDNLGGVGQGPGGSDNVIQRIGQYGGVWSRPAVWPGDGGYIYIPTNGSPLRVYKYGVDGTGKPTITLVASSSDNFGFSSSSAVVTSSGTTSGSALVWIVYAVDGNGTGAQLRAYDVVPINGAPVLRFSAPIGISSKFNPPGIAAGRVYTGTRDGQVLSFGPPVINLQATRSAFTGAVHFDWTGGNAPFTLTRSVDAAFSNPAALVDHQSVTSYDDPVLSDGQVYFYLVK